METRGLVVHGEAEPFSTALRSLVNNRLYSDVRFVVGQERQEVFAHRCLLACRCNFFQRLLGPEPGPGVPSPVVLSTVPAEAFLAVLEFLYTNSVKLHRHSVLEVLTAAVEYGLEELREICLEFVVKVLDVELVCEALQVAVTFGLGPLQERCIAFIEAHSQVQLLIFILTIPHTSFCSSLTHSRAHRRRFGLAASWSCQRPHCCPCCAVTSFAWTRLISSWRLGVGRAWERWSRSWKRGNATLCGEGMWPEVPRAAAGGAPCPASTIAFWTCPLSDQRPGLARTSRPKTTSPDVLCLRSGLPFPACWASEARERQAPRCVGGAEEEGRAWAWLRPNLLATLKTEVVFTRTQHWVPGHSRPPCVFL
ncbi:BTB/POZ domain-containing protein 19 isoform X2 [Phyllostomus discolor]|uniref:BTB/POZ domain-containing protein 19 isoform X2 n=1 Tax=Phyllostomus discolor TaxID=89673 RepID=A0A7E6DRM1_9CHIR|nr:BTB/POZ domain-containing protein 19 isoform X2 [Phyllostomus discolor]